MKSRILVVGGGASGIIAAISAKKRTNEVLIIEKMPKLGLKIGLTGKGKCNLTNESSIENHISNFGRNGKFLLDAYRKFFVSDLLSLLKKINIETITQRGNRVFPKSENAPLVARTLKEYALNQEIKIFANEEVIDLDIDDHKIRSVITKNSKFKADKFIFATGGKSYPKTGSDGNFLNLLAKTSHKVKPLIPSLVPLIPYEPIDPVLDKLKLKNIQVNCFINGKKKHSLFGEMLFFKDMLDGAIIITLSRIIATEIGKKKIQIQIDLKPKLTHQDINNRLLKEFNSGKELRNVLKNVLPAQITEYILKKYEIDGSQKSNQTSKETRIKIRNFIKEDFKFEIKKTAGFEKAIITKGGISLKEIDPKTMRSRIFNNLFLAGEMLDLDANTGGYNLQAAFSTGFLAGSSASENLDLS